MHPERLTFLLLHEVVLLAANLLRGGCDGKSQTARPESEPPFPKRTSDAACLADNSRASISRILHRSASSAGQCTFFFCFCFGAAAAAAGVAVVVPP